MFFIICHLHFTSSLRLIQCCTHGICDRICVHDNMPFCITGRTADRLDQRRLGTQKSFFIRVQDRNQCDLRNIQSFPQKINADQNIEYVQAHISHDLCTFQCINIRMQIPHTYSQLTHIVGKIFCHTLGQRCYQYFMFIGNLFIHFSDQIIDLSFYRPHFYFRIQKSGRPDHLLGS